ncbi:peptidoglycan/LPS O-acetylase OafA/YrhL [Rhodobacter sp. 140A]|nr:peptidoglycan/LPS O-acetylase OafA/YrhL [Rhodobacter sp. 140A]
MLIEHLRIETGLRPYGAVGVDVFFAISGFIIYFVTQNDRRLFFLKRVIRIVPLYWLATFAIAAVALIKPNLLNNAAFGVSHLIESLLFIPHFTDAQGLRPLLALGWTLNYEMMFYLLFALAMTISHARRFELCLLFLLLLWGVTNLLPLPETNGISFYRDPIFLEFIFGMAIARFVHGHRLQKRSGMLMLLVLGFVVFLPITIWRPTGIRIVDNGLPAALLFAAFLLAEPLFAAIAPLRKMGVFGGEISYALYLTHIYFLGAFARLLHLHGWALWGMCLITIPLIAWAIYRFVESPITHYLRRTLLD